MTTVGCGAPSQEDLPANPAGEVAGGDPAVLRGETVIDGVVRQGGEPVAGAYVRLLDRTGEFTAEVVTGGAGRFRFYAAPGPWTVRALARDLRGTQTVEATSGRNRVELLLSPVTA